MTPAHHLAAEWVAAFNSHDLNRILAHYRDDVQLTSPIYQNFSGRSATAEGRDELRRYFTYALDRFPNLRFTLLDVYVGAQSVALRYHTSIGDRTCVECMELDARGQVARVICHYQGDDATSPAG